MDATSGMISCCIVCPFLLSVIVGVPASTGQHDDDDARR